MACGRNDSLRHRNEQRAMSSKAGCPSSPRPPMEFRSKARRGESMPLHRRLRRISIPDGHLTKEPSVIHHTFSCLALSRAAKRKNYSREVYIGMRFVSSDAVAYKEIDIVRPGV